jgi:hypothetical protein
MKKLITFLITLLAIAPMFCFGMSTGWDGNSEHNQSCTVWRADSGYSVNQAGVGINWCSGNFDSAKRIYELELAVKELQLKIDSCGAVAGASGVDRIASLEVRIQTVEESIKALQKGIFDSLKGIIVLLLRR